MRKLQSNQDTIIEHLRSEILSGKLPPGMPLRQDTLAGEFGVSHIPIREALLRLEAEGLVAVRPRRGAIVAELSADEYEEILEMRLALECAALRSAIPRMGKEHFAKLEKILDQIDQRPSRWAELNSAFHVALYEAAKRPRMLAIITKFLRNDERYINHEERVLGNFAASQREHRQMLKLVKQKRVDEACALLSAHISGPAQRLISELRKKH